MTFDKVRIAAENWAEDYMTKNGRRFHNMLKDAFITGFVKGACESNIKIIHCKDCKHYWTHRCMDSMPTQWCGLNQTFHDPERDYCSLAERREDDFKHCNKDYCEL